MHRKLYNFLNKHIGRIIFILFFLFVTFMFLIAIMNLGKNAIFIFSLIFALFLFCGYKAAKFKRENDKIFKEKLNENNGNAGSRKAS